MITVELPETSRVMAARHKIPENQLGLHEYFDCPCQPRYVKGGNYITVIHKRLIVTGGKA